MNEIERIFQFEGRQLRIAMSATGKPMFCGRDVCELLELGNPNDNLSQIHPDDKGIGIADTRGGPQRMVFINESGLYSLIFGSRKAAAIRFKRWVTSEVLPAIRQTGRYQAEELTKQQLIAELAIMQPKADFYDAVADTEDTFSVGETAKLLQFERMGPNNLMNFLRACGFLMPGNVAKQEFISRGYFVLTEELHRLAGGRPRVRPTTRVRQKGVEFIRKILIAAGH